MWVSIVRLLWYSKVILIFIVLDLCPKPSDTKNPLSKQSHYGELEGIPGLFNALLEDDDEKWSVFTFPVDYDASLYGAANTKDSQFLLRMCKAFVDDNTLNSIQSIFRLI